MKLASYAGEQWILIRDNHSKQKPLTMTIEEAGQLRNRLNVELAEYRQRQIEKGKHWITRMSSPTTR